MKKTSVGELVKPAKGFEGLCRDRSEFIPGAGVHGRLQGDQKPRNK